MSWFSKAVSNLNPVKIVKNVANAVADIPGSVKGFVNNPLQSVEKNVGGVVNAMSLGTVGANNRVKIGGAVLTAGTAVVAANALAPKAPAPVSTVVPTTTAVADTATAVNGASTLKNGVDLVKTVAPVAQALTNGGSIPANPAAPSYGFQPAPVIASNGVSPTLLIGGVALAAIIMLAIRR